jgi:hypothetical protein
MSRHIDSIATCRKKFQGLDSTSKFFQKESALLLDPANEGVASGDLTKAFLYYEWGLLLGCAAAARAAEQLLENNPTLSWTWHPAIWAPRLRLLHTDASYNTRVPRLLTVLLGNPDLDIVYHAAIALWDLKSIRGLIQKNSLYFFSLFAEDEELTQSQKEIIISELKSAKLDIENLQRNYIVCKEAIAHMDNARQALNITDILMHYEKAMSLGWVDAMSAAERLVAAKSYSWITEDPKLVTMLRRAHVAYKTPLPHLLKGLLVSGNMEVAYHAALALGNYSHIPRLLRENCASLIRLYLNDKELTENQTKAISQKFAEANIDIENIKRRHEAVQRRKVDADSSLWMLWDELKTIGLDIEESIRKFKGQEVPESLKEMKAIYLSINDWINAEFGRVYYLARELSDAVTGQTRPEVNALRQKYLSQQYNDLMGKIAQIYDLIPEDPKEPDTRGLSDLHQCLSASLLCLSQAWFPFLNTQSGGEGEGTVFLAVCQKVDKDIEAVSQAAMQFAQEQNALVQTTKASLLALQERLASLGPDDTDITPPIRIDFDFYKYTRYLDLPYYPSPKALRVQYQQLIVNSNNAHTPSQKELFIKNVHQFMTNVDRVSFGCWKIQYCDKLFLSYLALKMTIKSLHFLTWPEEYREAYNNCEELGTTILSRLQAEANRVCDLQFGVSSESGEFDIHTDLAKLKQQVTDLLLQRDHFAFDNVPVRPYFGFERTLALNSPRRFFTHKKDKDVERELTEEADATAMFNLL